METKHLSKITYNKETKELSGYLIEFNIINKYVDYSDMIDNHSLDHINDDMINNIIIDINENQFIILNESDFKYKTEINEKGLKFSMKINTIEKLVIYDKTTNTRISHNCIDNILHDYYVDFLFIVDKDQFKKQADGTYIRTILKFKKILAFDLISIGNNDNSLDFYKKNILKK
ncbi:hypothetical protein [uncultured Bacteroides sp.]|uniref:hypothetical protein n=1 Tax=uncultured Bacteroides sp. TaxID=162156 RepID=UPI002AA7F5CE|nr:hypothetical protein [uncultured Bacteroides sp.]